MEGTGIRLAGTRKLVSRMRAAPQLFLQRVGKVVTSDDHCLHRHGGRGLPMKRAIVGAGSMLMLVGCMTGPTVETIASKGQLVGLDGYTLSASHTVRVDCKKVGTRALTSMGTTTSDGTAALSTDGGSVYAWAKDVVIPASCWVPVGPGIAASRVYATDVDEGARMAHVEDVLCAFEQMYAGSSPMQAGQACAERFPHRELRAPSGLATDTNPLTGMGAVQTLASGFGWAEGPLWDADDASLVFTDIAADEIRRLKNGVLTTVVQGTSTFTNGLDYDAEGSRLECQHATQRVIKRSPSGTITVVASTFGGLPFNSPNDAIAHASGTIFFTDPTYGSLPDLGGAVPQQPHQGVYRVAIGTGAVTLVDGTRQQPNGIALSPDHATLYVTDTQAGVVVQYPVTASGAAGPGSVLANVAQPDGLAVDVNGSLYVASSAGVTVLRPDGTSWGTIALPTAATNVAFGGTDRKSLYVTTPSALHRVTLAVPGLPAAF